MAKDVVSTTLHVAVRENDVNWVEILLFHGADPCATDALGETSLYLAAKLQKPDILMALLKGDVANASLSVPTRIKDTVLHECLRRGKKMTECIKELVRRGADVCVPNMKDETPIDVALENSWSKDIIELLILQGHGMDFDRQHPTVSTPLETTVHGCQQSYRLFDSATLIQQIHLRTPPLQQIGLHSRTVHSHDSLPVFFLQMGATRRLNMVLWYELNREVPGDCLLPTLMDSFAYLPSLCQLEHSVAYCCGLEANSRSRLSSELENDVPRLCQQTSSSVRTRTWYNALQSIGHETASDSPSSKKKEY